MWVGKIALFGKALVAALACGALAMCATWVGFLSFFAGRRKKQNKFPSNLHCPVIKLYHFLFQIVNIVSVCSSAFLHLLPTLIYPPLQFTIAYISPLFTMSLHQITKFTKSITPMCGILFQNKARCAEFIRGYHFFAKTYRAIP